MIYGVILILIGVVIIASATAPRHDPWPSEVVYSDDRYDQ